MNYVHFYKTEEHPNLEKEWGEEPWHTLPPAPASPHTLACRLRSHAGGEGRDPGAAAEEPWTVMTLSSMWITI